MKPNDVKDLKEWHSKQPNFYDLKKEFIYYCKKDVQVLLKCFLKFRKEMMQISGIDPTTRCFTLAGVAIEIFRAKVLEQSKIAITPAAEYSNNRIQSIIGNMWLD
jgi:hypothetical protein